MSTTTRPAMSPEGRSVPEPDSPPPRIPDYELLRRIGRGSYGEVWLGRGVTGVYRAVKVIHRRTFDHDRPYEREFRGIQKFEPVSRLHESQVDVLHVGRNDSAGYFYYVIELADDLNGLPDKFDCDNYVPRTLANELKRRECLPFTECVELGIRLATALDHLHRHGLVHRDVKPSNIVFIGGTPKLADIGLVAPQEDSFSFVGTMGYLPPEGPGSPQADIYGLGKVLYEASTGKDRREFPDPPTKLSGDANVTEQSELNEIVLKACNHDVRERYQSAQALRADLLLLESGRSIRSIRTLERRLAVLTRLGVGIGFFALIATGAYFYQQRQSREITRLATESRDRLVRLNVSQGTQRMDSGDYLNSLTWFTEALKLEQNEPARSAIHRGRIESVRRQCPRLAGFGVHPGAILDAGFSPDGRQIVIAGEDGTARVWDVTTSEPLSPILHHDGPVKRAVFSPDGLRVVTASDDCTAKVWVIATGEPGCSPLVHQSNVVCVAFSPDGKKIATASFDQTARVWDAATGKALTPALSHAAQVDWVVFSPDGRLVATSSRDHTARLWDADTGLAVCPPLTHEREVSQIVFSGDAKRVITASADGNARVWDVATGQPLTRQLKHRGRVNVAAFSPDGKRILTAGGMSGVIGDARVWDAETGELVALIEHHTRPILDACFSPDGKWIATSSSDQTARVWDAATGFPCSPVFQHNHAVTRVCFSTDGKKILTASRDRTWRIWDLTGDQLFSQSMELPHVVLRAEFDQLGQRVLFAEGGAGVCAVEALPIWGNNMLVEHATSAWDAEYSPIGTRLVTASGNAARVWGEEPRHLITPPLVHDCGVQLVRFSPDGTQIVTSSRENAYVWNADTGQPVVPPLTHSSEVVDASFSPDGRWIATGSGNVLVAGSGGEARVWDARTGRLFMGPLKHESAVVRVRFSPDGRRLLTACSDATENSRSAYLWEVRTNRPAVALSLRHGDGVVDAEFSPDGGFIVTASEDCTARIWNAFSGAPVGGVMRHKRTVITARFSPDGRRVLTGSHDGTARVWDAATAEPITPPLRCVGMVRSAVFNPNGTKVLVASGDLDGQGEVCLWNLTEGEYSVENSIGMAKLLSGKSIDHAGALIPADAEELLSEWRRMKPSHPADFGVTGNTK